VASDTEPAADSGGRQRDGQFVHAVVEDERLLDHHIEEILGAISDLAARRESGLDAGSQQLS
jgi:hypothetical protein